MSTQENVIEKINYSEIIANNLEDIYKKREGLFVFSKLNVDLKPLSVKQRKDIFVRILLPAINVVQKEILNNREIVKILKKKSKLTKEEKLYTINLFNQYKTPYGKWTELESKMIIYPASLILTQGALESAWGTSRFFKEANNPFGIWYTTPGKKIVAKTSRGNSTSYLKVYGNLKDAVKDITLIISRLSEYNNLRKLYWENKKPYEIAAGLLKYSEEGHLYIEKIRNTLEHNNFEKYDKIVPYN